jgi:membrane protease YdiL (CAAX protease family)
MATDLTHRRLPWLMLFARIVLFAAWQGVIALLYLLTGSTAAWDASAAWWMVTATLTNLVCIFLLIRLFKMEGLRYRDLFRFQRETVKTDLLWVLGLLILSIPAATLPNYFTAQWLFGDSQAVVPLFFRALPLWAILPTLVLFPLTIALAEIPTYFGYVMPRLEKQVGTWLAVLLAALALAAQHVTLPLVFDVRFILWRLLMFIPFALLLAIALRWRPRLLPYMVIVHGLLDLSAAWMVYTTSI